MRIPSTADRVYGLIAAFFADEVERRGRRCDFCQFTLERIWEMAEMMTMETYRFGILICGKTGNGKTTLMKALDRTLCHLADTGVMDPFDYGYSHVADFQLEIYPAKEIARLAKSDRVAYDKAVNCRMMGLDDLGEEPLEVLEYGNAVNPIIDLLEARYDRQRFTVATTNLDADEIIEKYGARVSDRLNEMMHMIVFGEFPSFRQ